MTYKEERGLEQEQFKVVLPTLKQCHPAATRTRIPKNNWRATHERQRCTLLPLQSTPQEPTQGPGKGGDVTS